MQINNSTNVSTKIDELFKWQSLFTTAQIDTRILTIIILSRHPNFAQEVENHYTQLIETKLTEKQQQELANIISLKDLNSKPTLNSKTLQVFKNLEESIKNLETYLQILSKNDDEEFVKMGELEITKKNIPGALEWFSFASSHPDAKFYLDYCNDNNGVIYGDGDGVGHLEILKLYEEEIYKHPKTSNKVRGYICYIIGKFYYRACKVTSQHGNCKNCDVALEWCKTGSIQFENVDCMAMLKEIYRSGYGVDINIGESEKWSTEFNKYGGSLKRIQNILCI